MKPSETSIPPIGRRQLLLAWLGTLAGCGGGGGVTAGAPGTGGTGIGLQGTITGFGSVIINNTKFDDSAASVWIDGVLMQSADLRIGMVANVQGSRQGSGASGQASRIDVWSVARGAITAVHGVGSFDVAGITVMTDSNTLFENAPNAASIQTVGMQVAVWGLQAGADARTWKATRVAVLASNAVTVTTGLLQKSGSVATLNGFTLSGASFAAFGNQQLVRATGVLNSGTGVLTASRIDPVGVDTITSGSAELEVGGVVTAWTTSAQFSIGAVVVDASQATVQGGTMPLVLDTHVEALGVMRNGVLIASQLEIKDASALGHLDITGAVEATLFQGQSDFVVRGQECDASQATVRQGSLASLAPGVRVRVVGVSSGEEKLTVTDLYVGVP